MNRLYRRFYKWYLNTLNKFYTWISASCRSEFQCNFFMVNILLWFRSAKEANEKKIILEENRPALELELQRTSAFLTVSVKEPETHKHVSAMTQPPSLSPAPPTEAPALEAPPAPRPGASSSSFSLGPHINGSQGCYIVPSGPNPVDCLRATHIFQARGKYYSTA
jgi:hypothetical protein